MRSKTKSKGNERTLVSRRSECKNASKEEAVVSLSKSTKSSNRKKCAEEQKAQTLIVPNLPQVSGTPLRATDIDYHNRLATPLGREV